MQLKVAYGRLKAECKKNKKYSLECVKVIEELKRELENARASGPPAGAGGLAAARAAREREAELSDKVREEKERRRSLEEEVERLRDRADKEARQLRDSEVRSSYPSCKSLLEGVRRTDLPDACDRPGRDPAPPEGQC
jgi:DNA repair exonuclease SbcCD ATPase subunit